MKVEIDLKLSKLTRILQNQIHQLKFKTLNAIDLAIYINIHNHVYSTYHIFICVNLLFLLGSQVTVLHHTTTYISKSTMQKSTAIDTVTLWK